MPGLKKTSIISVAIIFALALNLRLSIRNTQPSFALSPLEQARQDYNFQYAKYNQDKQNYISSRASFLSFETAKAKNEAFTNTKEYLKQIDQLYISYIYLLKEYGNRINWQSQEFPKEETYLPFDQQISYFNEHQQKTETATNLEQLPPLAEELKKKINGQFEPQLYRTLAIFEIVETESAFGDFKNISQAINDKLKPQSSKQETISILANWNSEITIINKNTKDYLDQSLNQIKERKDQEFNKEDFKKIGKYTNLAKAELKKSTLLFSEILRIQ